MTRTASNDNGPFSSDYAHPHNTGHAPDADFTVLDAEMREEMKFWDELSAEALENFERMVERAEEDYRAGNTTSLPFAIKILDGDTTEVNA
ncbi:hypothetical protein LCGC14_0386900 [marine sediment metagenome]|uniref:Uncharacterized protein n=1 Tax=marine sediment metagenome TaxID=412755 RepID=A0A0F9TIU7_9ZZZZ